MRKKGDICVQKMCEINNIQHVVVYNSVKLFLFLYRFSGLKKKDLEKAQRTLVDIQYRLKKIFCEDTILIGHSLEGDLKALKVCGNGDSILL